MMSVNWCLQDTSHAVKRQRNEMAVCLPVSQAHNTTNHNKYIFSVCRKQALNQLWAQEIQRRRHRERRICLCLVGPDRSFIGVLLWKRTPGPEILIHKRSCSPALWPGLKRSLFATYSTWRETALHQVCLIQSPKRFQKFIFKAPRSFFFLWGRGCW